MTIFQSSNWTEVLKWAVLNKMTAWRHFVIFSVTLTPFFYTWNAKGYGVFLSHLFYSGTAFQTNLLMQQRRTTLVLIHTSRVAMQLGRGAAWCNRRRRFKELGKKGKKWGKREKMVKREKVRGEKRNKKKQRQLPWVAWNQWSKDGRTDGPTDRPSKWLVESYARD